MDFKARNQQFNLAVESYGWLNVLEVLTPLDQGIKYFGTRNSKRRDICPSSTCSGHKLKKKIGNFELFKDGNGGGHCFKCNQNFSNFDVLMKFNGWDFVTAKKQVENLIGFRYDPNLATPTHQPVAHVPKGPSKEELESAKRNRQKMNRAWEESVPLNAPEAISVARYFAKRGITHLHSAMNEQVRFHKGMVYYIPLTTSQEDKCEKDAQERLALLDYCKNHPSFDRFIYKGEEPILANMGKHPCLLIMIRTPNGEARRLHRIFLDDNGNKASFHLDGFEVKRMMPGGYGLEVTGCSCYIDPPSEVRGVAEGLETVLAVKQVTGMPMDCTISAGGLKNYVPPKGTKYIYIFEDKDRSKTGEIVAKEAEERLIAEGYGVIRLTPPLALGDSKSIDWLDVLERLGPNGFPQVAKQWEDCLVK